MCSRNRRREERQHFEDIGNIDMLFVEPGASTFLTAGTRGPFAQIAVFFVAQTFLRCETLVLLMLECNH